MASLEELKQRLQSDEWSKRRDAVRELAQMKDQRNEVISLLKHRLEADDDDDVIKACVETLYNLGLTVKQISRILSSNPHFPYGWHWHHRLLHLLHEEGGVVAQVVEHTLRRRWWRLSEIRRHFDMRWQLEDRSACPECHEMWHEIAYLLRRHDVHGRHEAEWLIAAIGRWWGNLRWRFGCHDFEELMSLQVKQGVAYEEVNTLRFRFLDAFVTDAQGHPIREWARDWLREFNQDWSELLRTEEEFDRLRDEISELHRQQEEILREVEEGREGEEGWEAGELPHLPQELQSRWKEISQRLRRLESDEEPGELQRLRRQLEEATERLLPQLRERGVRFQIIEVEGVLGEYNFYEHKITLYPPMIELAAGNLARALRRHPEEAYEDLYTITEMHETAHATTHLGIDSNGHLWKQPEQGTSELHELLAQFYTLQLIRRIKESRLERLFLELNKQQPERYRYWQILEGVPLELARNFLTGKRAGWFKWDLLSLANQAAKIVGSAIPLLCITLSAGEFQAFIGGLKPILQRLEAASTRRELGEAAAAFLDHCESQPFVRSLLQSALPYGLHSAAYRRLLLASYLAKGKPIKAPTLRLTIDQIRAARTVALMHNDLICRNEIVHGLRAAEELRTFMSPDELVKTLAAQLPANKAEARQVLEQLQKMLQQS